jgi:hypothetical protein
MCSLLDDALSDTIDGSGYCLYADDDRLTKQLPDNPRAGLLPCHCQHD